jgi:hypothetical protein
VGFDLGKELARRIDSIRARGIPSPGAIMDGLKAGEGPHLFGPTPERERVLNFTAPFLVIEHGYLVPAGSRSRPSTQWIDRERASVRRRAGP